MSTTLKIDRATLAGEDGYWSIAMAGGKIIDIARHIETTDQESFNAEGRLVIPGLVDGHLHLDKALLLAQHPAQTGTFQEALAVGMAPVGRTTIKGGKIVAQTQVRRGAMQNSGQGSHEHEAIES